MINHRLASELAYELGVDFNFDDVAWGVMDDERRMSILFGMFPDRGQGIRIEFATLQSWIETLKAGGHPEVPYSPNNSEMAAWAAGVSMDVCRDVVKSMEVCLGGQAERPR